MRRSIGCQLVDPRDQDICRSGISSDRTRSPIVKQVNDGEVVEVEGVLPKGFSEGKSADEFMAMLPQLDEEFKARVSTAKAEGKVLRYVGKICEGKCKVSIVAVDQNNPLYKVKDGENALAFYTRYYQPIPLLLRGYGAGNAVTAAGIFADILRTLQH